MAFQIITPPSVEPPSTTISCRVIWLASLEARNRIVLAISEDGQFSQRIPSLNCSPNRECAVAPHRRRSTGALHIGIR